MVLMELYDLHMKKWKANAVITLIIVIAFVLLIPLLMLFVWLNFFLFVFTPPAGGM